jgi:hypothetical protein
VWNCNNTKLCLLWKHLNLPHHQIPMRTALTSKSSNVYLTRWIKMVSFQSLKSKVPMRSLRKFLKSSWLWSKWILTPSNSCVNWKPSTQNMGQSNWLYVMNGNIPFVFLMLIAPLECANNPFKIWHLER